MINLRRGRQWFLAGIAISSSILILSLISGTLYLRNTEHFQILESGAWLANSAGFQFRLDRLETWDEIPHDNGDSTLPYPGADFLVARVTVKAPGVIPERHDCVLRLIGTERREWSADSDYAMDSLVSVCKGLAEKAAGGTHMEATALLAFQIPIKLHSEVVGLAPRAVVGFEPTHVLPVK
ncbi:MAG: hypothetical protein LBU38_02295 [Propionibacteriaceae bacterium]|jgi:hypothetical protein|nr:hypothetical protein [Propionibacteriaceae bacterium]